MEYNYLAFILVIVVTARANGCPKYKCMGATAVKEERTCLSKNSQMEIEVYSCPKGPGSTYKCGEYMMHGGDEEFCKRSARKHPGERVLESEWCVNNITKNGYCRGREIGEECKRNSDCDIGLYCQRKSFLCEDNTRTKNSYCESPAHCPPLFGCHNSKCTQFATLPLGTKLRAVNGLGISDVWLCQSFWADPNSQKCSGGFNIGINQRVNKDKCDIIYNGKHTGEKWGKGKNLFLKGLAEGSCCYSGDGEATCPHSTAHQREYYREIASFIGMNINTAVSTKSEGILNNHPWTTLGLSPIQRGKRGYLSALKAYCSLFFHSCAYSVSCMHGQIHHPPISLLPYCFQVNAFQGPAHCLAHYMGNCYQCQEGFYLLHTLKGSQTPCLQCPPHCSACHNVTLRYYDSSHLFIFRMEDLHVQIVTIPLN